MMRPSMPQKVAYLVNQYPKVSHTFIRREIRALEAVGVEVHRFSVRAAGPTPDVEDAAEAERTRVLLRLDVGGALALGGALSRSALRAPIRTLAALRKALSMGGRSERGRLVHLAYLAEAALLRDATARAGIPHVHAHFGTNSAAVAMLCEMLGGPSYSFTVHGPEEFDKPDALSLTEKIERARFVAGVSSFGRSQLLRRTPARDWHKVKVVPCGVDESYLDDSAPCPAPAAPRLVCVGRICEQKAQILLLEACAQIAKEGTSIELVLVGDGEMRADAEAFIARHGLAERVRITGWADSAQVRAELLAARVLVLPSFAEGLPVVIMEALALGRPVISTYVAGIPELVENGVCGWLVPAGDVPSLVTAIKDALARTPAELDRMGNEGRRRVLLRHDARQAAALLATLFASVG